MPTAPLVNSTVYRGEHVDVGALLVDEGLDAPWLEAGGPQQDVVDVAAGVHEVPPARQRRVGPPGGARKEDGQAVLGDDGVDQAYLADGAAEEQLAGADEASLSVSLVCDGQHLARDLGGVEDAAGIGGGGRHRLLDQDVQAGLQAPPHLLPVLGVRGGYDDGVETSFREQLFPVLELRHLFAAEGAPQLRHGIPVGVAERRDAGVVPLRDLVRVVPSHAAGPDDTCPDCRHCVPFVLPAAAGDCTSRRGFARRPKRLK